MKRMKNRIFCLLVLLGLGMQAHATVISFDPSDQTTSVGSSVSVDLVIADLGADILTTFDLSIFYDDTILSFDSFVFGTGLDVFGLGANIVDVVDWGGGEIEVLEISFDFDADLEAFQPNDFVLGTFVFSGLNVGVSALDIFIWELGGALAAPLDADVVGGSIEVNAVPEPGTLALLGIGLLGMGAARRRKKA